MRTGVAVILGLVLIGFVAICPLMACPLNENPQAHGCCHNTPRRHTSCPSPVFDCPYLILAKSKTALAVSQIPSVPKSVSPVVRYADPSTVVAVSSRVSNSTYLFLRIRVLLI